MKQRIDVPSQTQLDNAKAIFDADWGAVDEVLYDLCRRFPEHGDRRVVMAKVALIGRAYQAGLERCITPPRGEQAVVVAGNHLYERGREVAEILGTLRSAAEPLDADGMRLIVQQHGLFTALLRAAPHCRMSPRSFASKYLHFHHPAVPIFDDYANQRLTRLVPWWSGPVPFDCPPGGDDEYWRYCARLFRLYTACRSAGVEAPVKALDAYLWQVPSKG